jgi:hypothetical protein
LHRIQVLEDAQNASKTAINKRRTVERLKGSSNISTQKVDDAIAEMQDVSVWSVAPPRLHPDLTVPHRHKTSTTC